MTTSTQTRERALRRKQKRPATSHESVTEEQVSSFPTVLLVVPDRTGVKRRGGDVFAWGYGQVSRFGMRGDQRRLLVEDQPDDVVDQRVVERRRRHEKVGDANDGHVALETPIRRGRYR